MDGTGVAFASLIIVLAIPLAFEIRRRPETDGTKTLMTIALVAMVLIGVVNMVKSLGWMADGTLYWSLKISLLVLFGGMVFQVLRGRDAAHRKREGNVS